MTIPQQKFRELTFQLLYSHDLGKADSADMLPMMMKELSVTKRVVVEAQQKVEAIEKNRAEIDAMIKKTSRSYEFDRIQRVELNVLRLALYELFYEREVPPKVVIAEAIRMARKFGTPASVSFVNAILDHLYQSSIGAAMDDAAIKESIEALRISEQAAEEAALDDVAVEDEVSDE
jgi:N utilization substance protein B